MQDLEGRLALVILTDRLALVFPMDRLGHHLELVRAGFTVESCSAGDPKGAAGPSRTSRQPSLEECEGMIELLEVVIPGVVPRAHRDA
jgi:hypothetical protein